MHEDKSCKGLHKMHSLQFASNRRFDQLVISSASVEFEMPHNLCTIGRCLEEEEEEEEERGRGEQGSLSNAMPPTHHYVLVYFFKLQNVFLQITKSICKNCKMYLSILLNVFVKISNIHIISKCGRSHLATGCCKHTNIY